MKRTLPHRRDALRKMATSLVSAPLAIAAARSARAGARLFAPGELETGLSRLLAAGRPAALAQAVYFRLDPGDLPWHRALFPVAAGQAVTFLLAGRWQASRPDDIWFEPGVAFHARVGGAKPLYNPMNNTGTMTAAQAGPVEIARSAGEWASDDGVLATPLEAYVQADGLIEGIALAWHGDPLAGLTTLAARGDVGGLLNQEIARLKTAPAVPDGWRHFFMFGDAGIFSTGSPGEICCQTHKNVGILQKEVSAPLDAGLALNWRWLVDELPANRPEDQFATHDYLSIAAEFDDGQDLTYMWSAGMPPGKVFKCPLPGWHEIETHMVVRSGREELGLWREESRPLAEDYRAHIGGKATRLVRVWLIANSVFMRRSGSCRFADIAVAGPGGTQKLL
jgi:hypothetical protein